VPLAGGAPVVGSKITVSLIDGLPVSATSGKTTAGAGGLVVLGSGSGSGAGIYAPSPHDMNSAHHAGEITTAQATWAMPLAGGTFTGTVGVSSGVTIDGVDISAHAANVDAHHVRSHAITSASDHTVTGSTYQLVGLTGTNTLGLHTPASTVAANTIPIGGVGGAITWSGLQTMSAGVTVNGALGTFNAGATVAAGQTLTTPAITAAASLTINPVGDVVFNPTGNDIYPSVNYDNNLGLINKKWLSLHAAELWVETLVAQNTIATIGGRILIGPTNQLQDDFDTDDNTVRVKYNNFAAGDIVYLEASGKVEFLRVLAYVTYEFGSYYYVVTRDLDGTGANDWYAGDAVFNTGTTGDGFIDLYSERSIKSATQYGPTIVGWARNSTTYNDISERWAIGNLNGLYGISADTYGVGIGNYSGSNYLLYDGTAFTIKAGGGGVTINQLGLDLNIPASATVVRSSSISFVSSTTDIFQIGAYLDSGNYALEIKNVDTANAVHQVLIAAASPTTYAASASLGASNATITTGVTASTAAGVVLTFDAGTPKSITIDDDGIDIIGTILTGINLGTATGAAVGEVIGTYSTNATLQWEINNANVGSGAQAALQLTTDVMTGRLAVFSDAAGGGERLNLTASGGYILFGTLTDDPVVFYTNNAEVARLTSSGELQFGTSQDTNIYRSGTNVLSTDDTLNVALDLSVGTTRVLTYAHGSGAMNIQASTGTWAQGYYFKGSSGTALSGFGAYGSSDTLTYHWIGGTYNAPVVKINPAGSVVVGNAIITPEGGFAILATAAENLTAGEIVSVSTATSERVMKAAANSDMPCGAVYATATSGNPVWIVVAGFAQVTFKGGVTPTRGEVAFVSDTAGVADRDSALPAVAVHNREIGHVYKTGAAGSTTTCVLHWN
jgi:hypothetical protein